jgi:hypothetical protein
LYAQRAITSRTVRVDVQDVMYQLELRGKCGHRGEVPVPRAQRHIHMGI